MTNSKTLEYYNQNAKMFSDSTVDVDFHITQDKFLSYMPVGGRILDFGCGSGRDAKYFLDAGFEVDATDGSEELCRIASDYVGIAVKHMYFEELADVDKYDGIWACSSILHLEKNSLKEVLGKMFTALKPGGVIYTSFKYGDFEGVRNGRYFTDLTEESFVYLIESIKGIAETELWITKDVRKDREENWLNILISKS